MVKTFIVKYFGWRVFTGGLMSAWSLCCATGVMSWNGDDDGGDALRARSMFASRVTWALRDASAIIVLYLVGFRFAQIYLLM